MPRAAERHPHQLIWLPAPQRAVLCAVQEGPVALSDLTARHGHAVGALRQIGLIRYETYNGRTVAVRA